LVIISNNQQIRYQVNSTMNKINFNLQNYFFVLLFSSGGCSISRLLDEYIKPVMELFKDHLINGKSINENSIILFDNVITLMHILFTVDDSKPVIGELYLTTKIIHYLCSRRVNSLTKGETYDSCLDLYQLTIIVFTELINKSQSSLSKQFIPKIKAFLNDWIKSEWFFTVNLININYLYRRVFSLTGITHDGTVKAINNLLTVYTLNMINHGIYFAKGKKIESKILDINSIETFKDFSLEHIGWEEWDQLFRNIYSLYKDWTPNTCKIALTIIINNFWVEGDRNKSKGEDEGSYALSKGFISASLNTLTEISNRNSNSNTENEAISQKTLLSYISLFKPRFNVEVIYLNKYL